MQGEVQSSSARLAVLIDADNANPNLIEPLLQEIAIYSGFHGNGVQFNLANA